MDVLIAARPLCVLAGDCEAEGDWFVRAGLLLVDLSRNERAHQFMLLAGSSYFLSGSSAKQAEAVIGRAYVLAHARLYGASVKLLELVLPLLKEEQDDLRRFAHETLAKNFRELGELPKASRHLSMALKLMKDDLARASCLWGHAKLLRRLGDDRNAIAAFREALPLLAKVTGAGELAEMAMEYAKVLLKEGRWPELRLLAADLSGWIQELRGTRKLRDTIEDFTALVEANKLSAMTLKEILQKIRKFQPIQLERTEIPGA